MNPTLGIAMYIYMVCAGYDSSIFFKDSFEPLDWFLVTFFSIGTVLVQTLKYNALQYEEPGKLSHYQYFLSIYQLIYDVTLLNSQF